ncbi:MAG: histidine kinase [Saprospiraceae bacterium]|nr:histidine kinase [Saprospiraceae bacterium]
MSLKNKIPIIILHILFWLLSSYFFVTFFSIEAQEVSINTDGETITETYYDSILQEGLTIGILIRIIFFYFHLNIIQNYLTTKKITRYILGLVLLIGFAFLAENIIVALLYNTWPVPGIERIFIMIYTFYGLTSLGYGLYYAWKSSEIAKSELKQQVVQSELAALKSQFDPHFIFNTLNSLLYIAEKEGNQKISQAIEEMSALMRSIIYDFKSPTISLNTEIDLIRKYINLQLLKYDEKDEISIDLYLDPSLNDHDAEIAPLILLPFVENAMKHGIDIYKKSVINIETSLQEGNLTFAVSNTNHSSEVNVQGGIGLENIRKRLVILYPKQHSLNIENGLLYKIKLELNLDHKSSQIL